MVSADPGAVEPEKTDMTKPPSSDLLKALINPASVAIVGASGTPGRVTARPVSFLRDRGFAGQIWPVNPNRSQVMGYPAFASFDDLPGPVDHAYILLDAEPAMDAVRACARAGVSAVTVLADGFAEAGLQGQRRQTELAQIAREAGIYLIGPNSMGVADTRHGFFCTTNAAFSAPQLPPGRFAVVSQSGSVIGTIASRGAARGLGFSTYVSVGNEAVVGAAQVAQLLLSDPDCDGVLLFLETIRNAEDYAELARAGAAANKPVVAYVVGRSQEGQALAVSHTGAMTGGGRAIDAFLKHHGIARVQTFEALLETPAALTLSRRMANRAKSATVVTTTGGGGAMVIDLISELGVPVQGPSQATCAALADLGLPIGRGKLIDVTLAGTRYEVMNRVVSTLIDDAQTGLVIVAIGSSAQFNPEVAVRPIIDAVAAARGDAAPVLAFPLPDAPQSLALFQDAGIPAFRTLEACAEAVSLLVNQSGCTPSEPTGGPDSKPEPKPKADMAASGSLTTALDEARSFIETIPPQVTTLDEVASSRLFRALGVPYARSAVLTLDAQSNPHPATVDLALAYPVAAKLIVSGLAHKSEAGAVRVGLPDRAALDEAIAQMTADVSSAMPQARIEGVLVQEMQRGVGEGLIGLTRDPLVGPMVTVGMGGVATEIYQDFSMRPAPVSAAVARAMLDEVIGFKALQGFRGKPAGDLEALAAAVCAVSELATVERISEAEINPLIIGPVGHGAIAVDALIRLSAPV